MTSRSVRDVLVVSHHLRSFVSRDAQVLGARYRTNLVVASSVRGLLRAVAAVPSSRSVLVWFVSFHALPLVLVARVLRRPVVVVPGGYEVTSVPDLGYGWQGSWWRRWYVATTLALATEAVAVSPAMVDRIRRAGPRASVRLVPNAIPELPSNAAGCEPWEQREYDAATAIVTSTNASRRNKGIDLFLAAAVRLPQRKFMLIGDLDSAPSNVTVTGVVPHELVPGLLSRSRIYVQASRGHEAFGVGVLEAMLVGCTPVVTPVGGLPWVVGRCGVVLEESTAEALIDAIESVLRGPSSDPSVDARIRFGAQQREIGLAVALGLVDPDALSY